jgi:hypothetical protein
MDNSPAQSYNSSERDQRLEGSREEGKPMLVKHLSVLLVLCSAAAAARCDAVPQIAPADFDRLLAEIKPQRGESPWREIPWLTNVTEARRKASAENKPLVIFTAADGSPLSRT